MPSHSHSHAEAEQDSTVNVDSLRALEPIPVVSDSMLAQFGIVRSDKVPDGTLESDGHNHGDSHSHGNVHPSEAELALLNDSLYEGTPFLLDEEAQEDREACLLYALSLLEMYTQARDRIATDADHYADLSDRLEEAYNYAQNRYKLVQKRIFIDGQDNYFKVLKRFGRYASMAVQETRQKYMSTLINHDHLDEQEGHHHHHNESEWRGPVVTGFFLYILGFLLLSLALSVAILYLLNKCFKTFRTDEFRRRRLGMALLIAVVIFSLSIMIASNFVNHNFIKAASSHLLVYAWLLAAIIISLLIRVKPENLNKNLVLYAPVMLMGLIVITFRIIFIPNRLVNLIYPPLLLGFTVWQSLLCRKHLKDVDKRDRIYAWITLVVFVATTVMAWIGYVLLAVQVMIWWLFQLAAIETITAIYDLLELYSNGSLIRRKDNYLKQHEVLDEEKSGAFIMVTWFFDFLKKAALPILAILSVPLCINMAAKVFDLSEICKEIFYKPFFNLSDTKGNPVLHLSLYKLVLVTSLFFIFKYVDYLAKSLYRHTKLQKAMAKNEGKFVHANQVNLTLANNVISILVWGIYIIACVNLLRIPMGALSIVAAGLATGLGLAMKDVLNNFIYGIQLMAGRLRVGDYIECDGVRGQVESINYQSTQIATLEGDIMAFTNTTLFNKNFRNLTKDNPYVFCRIYVGVSYGSDIDKVREVLINAL
ncbi:MAG: mechanosensitive ion channel, partial [Bacteroidales bacterium]|nr:mechanosensitive ion channel [Bacteroidales bacterium]